jgi:hypothetical protein
MRSQDAREVMASHGKEPLEALLESFRVSSECFTIIHEDGEIVGMYGIADCNIFASPWLLGTDKLPETKRVMLPVSAKWVEEKNNQYPLLLNYVHVDNTVSMRWLKTLGFKFIKLDKEHGVGREPFYQFVRIKKNV